MRTSYSRQRFLRSDEYHRRSVRLKGYDYARGGMYFVTICAKKREELFGNIERGRIVLTDIGKIVVDEWQHTPDVRPNVVLDEWVVMPNHLHGILHVKSPMPCRGTMHCAPTRRPEFHHIVPQSLGAIIRGFKSAVTHRIRSMPGGYDGDV